MDAIQSVITRARRRLLLCRAVRWLGWLTLAGLTAAAVLLLVDRLVLSPAAGVGSVPWWTYLVVVAVVLVLTPVLAWRGMPSAERVAALLDDRLHLKDRLSTALYARSMADEPFAKQVIEDAERTAGQVSVREALPVQPGRAWGWAPAGAAVLALLALFVPADVDVLGLGQRQAQQAAADEQADNAQRRIVEASATMPEPDELTDEAEAARAEDLLNQLAELSQRDLRNPDVRRDAQAQLSNLQDRIANDREQREQNLRTMRNAMSQIDPGQSGPANRFADALRRGDFQNAQRELEELARAVRDGDLSDSEKQALQQQLQNMSDQLAQRAAQQQQRQQQADEQLREQLREQGLSEQQIDQLQQQGFDQQVVEDALRQQYEQQGMNGQQAQQQARQQAQQMQQQQQQAQQSSPSGEMCEGLGQSMEQMARSLGQPGQGGQQGQQGQQGQNGQQGQQGQGFSQGAWQGQQQLDQMAQMQQALKDMGVTEQQLQQAMQQLSQPQRAQQNGGGGQQPQQQAGVGPGAGTGSGGDPLGQERRIEQYQTQARDRSTQRQGRVIASWHEQGEMSAGEANIEFDQAVSEARSDAERAVSEDRVPRRYHGTIREYFKQLPESADETRRAPAAPR